MRPCCSETPIDTQKKYISQLLKIRIEDRPKWLLSEAERNCCNSPLDLDVGKMTPITLSKVVWHNYERPPQKMKLTNTGHTMILSAKWHQERPYLTGGPLLGKYVFSQLHFHWGENNFEGSEHTVETVPYPLEMHVIHFKSLYRSQDAALDENDGLCVLVYFFKIQENPNPAFNEIINAVGKVHDPYSSTHMAKVALRDYLPKFNEDYFFYWGSIMTNECDHIMLWMIHRMPMSISKEQMDAFRSVLDPNRVAIKKNFRNTKSCTTHVFHANPCIVEYPTIHVAPCEKTICSMENFNHIYNSPSEVPKKIVNGKYGKVHVEQKHLKVPSDTKRNLLEEDIGFDEKQDNHIDAGVQTTPVNSLTDIESKESKESRKSHKKKKKKAESKKSKEKLKVTDSNTSKKHKKKEKKKKNKKGSSASVIPIENKESLLDPIYVNSITSSVGGEKSQVFDTRSNNNNNVSEKPSDNIKTENSQTDIFMEPKEGKSTLKNGKSEPKTSENVKFKTTNDNKELEFDNIENNSNNEEIRSFRRGSTESVVRFVEEPHDLESGKPIPLDETHHTDSDMKQKAKTFHPKALSSLEKVPNFNEQIRRTSKEIESCVNNRRISNEMESSANNRRTSKEMEPSANNRRTSKEMEQNSSNRRSSKEMEQNANNRRTSKEIEPSANNRKTSKEMEQNASNRRTSKEMEPSANNRKTSKEMEQNASNRRTSKEMEPSANNRKTSKEMEQNASNRRTSKEMEQNASNCRTSKEIEQNASNRRASKEMEPSANNRKTSKEMDPSANKRKTSKEIVEPIPRRMSKEVERSSGQRRTSKEIEQNKIDSNVVIHKTSKEIELEVIKPEREPNIVKLGTVRSKRKLKIMLTPLCNHGHCNKFFVDRKYYHGSEKKSDCNCQKCCSYREEVKTIHICNCNLDDLDDDLKSDDDFKSDYDAISVNSSSGKNDEYSSEKRDEFTLVGLEEESEKDKGIKKEIKPKKNIDNVKKEKIEEEIDKNKEIEPKENTDNEKKEKKSFLWGLCKKREQKDAKELKDSKKKTKQNCDIKNTTQKDRTSLGSLDLIEPLLFDNDKKGEDFPQCKKLKSYCRCEKNNDKIVMLSLNSVISKREFLKIKNDIEVAENNRKTVNPIAEEKI